MGGASERIQGGTFMKTSGVGTFVARCGLALMVMLLLGHGIVAQSTTDGAVGGTVVDPSGAAVPNAKVTVRNTGTNAEQTVTTDESGYYRVAKLTPATYTVTITVSGFADLRAENVIVEVGSLTELSPHLSVSSAGATVLVTSEMPQLNTTSQEFAPVLDQTAIANLPINGGRWSSFVLLTPGAVSDASGFGLISFRGMSTLLNNNTVDGGDNNQAFFSEERGRTRIGYSSAKASVQEFQVNTSNYSAEYGRAAGAVINTVTKSGSNELHGEVYFYDRDNEWGATNPFTRLSTQTAPGLFTSAPYKPKDVRKIYGGGIGGPILKDRLFLFFAGDRYDRNFPGTAVSGSPNAFFAAPVADLSAFGGSCQALTTPSTNNPNQTAIKNSSSNGANVLTATWGVAKLFTNLTSTLSNEARFQYGRDFEFEFAQPSSAYEQANFITSPLFS